MVINESTLNEIESAADNKEQAIKDFVQLLDKLALVLKRCVKEGRNLELPNNVKFSYHGDEHYLLQYDDWWSSSNFMPYQITNDDKPDSAVYEFVEIINKRWLSAVAKQLYDDAVPFQKASEELRGFISAI